MAMYHSFNVRVAEKYGMAAAVIMEHLRFWIEKNKANERHYHDGMYWTYSSIKAFSELFPYLSAKQIRTTIDKLKEQGLIIVGTFNGSVYDKTKWYALTESAFALLGNTDLPCGANRSAPQGKPIPDTINTVIPPTTTFNVHSYIPDTPMKKEDCIKPSTLNSVVPPSAAADQPLTCNDIKNLYNEICVSLPKCTRITDARRKAIRARTMEGYGRSDFKAVFEIAEASPFLRGEEGKRKWKADFDFCVGPKMTKILEGAYGAEGGDPFDEDAGYGFRGRDDTRVWLDDYEPGKL